MLFTVEDHKVVVAFSSRALFDLEKENAIFAEKGQAAYEKYQRQNIDKPLKPGVALDFAFRLLAINEGRDHVDRPVECVMISRCDPYTGMRASRSARHYGMNQLCAGAHTKGTDPVRFLDGFKVDLFLTADEQDARAALMKGHGAALVYPRRGTAPNPADREIRIAYDFDGVLGSDESEQVTHSKGLDAYLEHEERHAGKIMSPGPFKKVALAFNQLKQAGAPIRTAIITARVAPYHERAIVTADRWGVEIDELVTTGSTPKAQFVRDFGAHAFFEDTPRHAIGVAPHTLVGHVVHGIKNEKPAHG